MHDNGGAVIERPAQHRRGRVVDNQRHPHLPPDPGDLTDRKDFELRVRQGLGVIAAGSGVRGAAEILWVARIDKAHLDPHRALHRVQEQVPGAAVKIGRATKLSPACAMLLTQNIEAAWPEPSASAATPPSSAATRCSRTSLVGFMIRV